MFIWNVQGVDVTFEECRAGMWRSEPITDHNTGGAVLALAWRRGKAWRAALQIGNVARLSTVRGAPQRALADCYRWFHDGGVAA
jgi:hypothetical protein